MPRLAKHICRFAVLSLLWLRSLLAAESEARSHWAFQPVAKPLIPSVWNSGWIKTPVDAFVLSGLEKRTWSPAGPAEKRTLIRRVYFDVTGLPPAPEAVDAFLSDRSPDAYEKLVDGLLDTREYGEHWAQHWLDVVRYAETEGYEYDRHIPDAWRYRDYVINALNSDKPFDRFVTEQIAGDEISPGNPECETASIFHRLGPIRRNAGNPEIALSRNEVLTERTDIIGAAFLGLTIGCARCHNHKLEPILQKDYYRMEAYFAATDEHNINLGSSEEQVVREEKAKVINGRLKKLRDELKKATGEKKSDLENQVEALEDQLPAPLPTIPATHNDFEKRTEIHVLKRGVWENKQEAVAPRPPDILVSPETPELPADCPNPRTHLAQWLTDPQNPLTARVFVNRLWQDHFGMGLVKTPNDFGTKGDRPSHPELLDWLAATFMENGWRLKPIHRLILLSNTYRQASFRPDSTEFEKTDPENRLLWRFNRRRLSAEEIRDAMLAVSGRLEEKPGGRSVMVPVDPELPKLLYKPSQWQSSGRRADYHCRSIYLIAKRNLHLPFMDTFDAPPLLTSCPRRQSSTHPPQALELLNGTLSNDLAESFARRLNNEAKGNREAMIDRAFSLALGRLPTAAEKEKAFRFVLESSAPEMNSETLKEFALAMFNLNGFLYIQ
jgi:hypothetical protein